jgi:uncharacterized protein YggE
MAHKRSLTVGVAALVVLAAVGALTLGLGTAGADSPGASTTDRSITVSATGDASATPDEAVVGLAVTAAGDDPGTVRDELVTGAEDLRRALDELGVEYKTVSYSLSEPRRHEREPNTPGYRGVHAFQVTLDDPDATGSVVDAAADANASVRNVQLTLSDGRQENLRDEAITNAMSDARQQANTIAAAGGLSVVDTFSVTASQRHYRPVSYEMAAAGGDGGGSTSIEGGDVTVSYQVEVTYNATAN